MPISVYTIIKFRHVARYLSVLKAENNLLQHYYFAQYIDSRLEDHHSQPIY